MSDDQRTNAGGILLSFMVGALSGAALAVLFAPRSGRETREFLGEKFREGVDRGRDFKEKAVTKSRELVDDAGDFVEKQKETIKDGRDRLAAAVDAGRQAFKSERGKQG